MSVFEQIGCRPIINASGKMTALGASAVTPSVAAVLAEAAQDYVELKELLVKAGRVIAEATGTPDGCPATGAAGAIVIGVAGVIAGEDLTLIEAIPDVVGVPNEIIIQKGQVVNFGASITQLLRIAGGVPVEVGQANRVDPAHISGAIGPRTAALLYVKSHHAVQKGMVSLEEMAAIAKQHGLPLLVDAAAEEDFGQYYRRGGDLVFCSGGKALNGPTSGFLCGRADLVAAARAQYAGVGRPMKVGKEAVLALCAALTEYARRPDVSEQQRTAMQRLCDRLNLVPGLQAGVSADESGRAIYRARIVVDAEAFGMDAVELTTRLKQGAPAIFTRDHYANTGSFMVDPRPLLPGQDEQIAGAIEALARKEN